ncbi:Acryloyl-CoA reductase electron transfer subunit gamma [compost metagenome]
MNILVCMKQVPVVEHHVSDELNRNECELRNNPNDLFALEASLQLRETYGGKVICLSMGPLQCEGPMREALSMGADEVILLTSPAFSGADTLATSYTLASAIRSIEAFDVIVTGEQSMDGETGQVGPSIAEHLGIPHITHVKSMEIDLNHYEITVSKNDQDIELELKVPLPALLSIRKNSFYPRLPTIRGTLKAQTAEIKKWTEEEILADPQRIGLKGSATRVLEARYNSKNHKHSKGTISYFDHDKSCISTLVNAIGSI